jgi:hypothetical protein
LDETAEYIKIDSLEDSNSFYQVLNHGEDMAPVKNVFVEAILPFQMESVVNNDFVDDKKELVRNNLIEHKVTADRQGVIGSEVGLQTWEVVLIILFSPLWFPLAFILGVVIVAVTLLFFLVLTILGFIALVLGTLSYPLWGTIIIIVNASTGADWTFPLTMLILVPFFPLVIPIAAIVTGRESQLPVNLTI